jgi:hypothetical protein
MSSHHCRRVVVGTKLAKYFTFYALQVLITVFRTVQRLRACSSASELRRKPSPLPRAHRWEQRGNVVRAPVDHIFFHHLLTFFITSPFLRPRSPPYPSTPGARRLRADRIHRARSHSLSIPHPSDDQLRSTLATTVQR